MATITKQDSNAQARVYFQTPPGTEDTEVVQKQGRVTVKYDRKELRKRLNLEEWIIEQLTVLYDCEEEEIPELEIDVDELLDMPTDLDRAIHVKDFIEALLEKVKGLQKLSTPPKKSDKSPT